MEWQAPRRQLRAAFVCSPTKGKHMSHSSWLGLVKWARLSNNTEGTCSVHSWLGKKLKFSWLGCFSFREKQRFCIFLCPLILTRDSTWRVQVKVLCVRSCRRLQPSDKLGINSLERNLGSSPLTVVTECLSDTSLGDIKERSCLMVPSLHLSPPNSIFTISYHAGAKAAAGSLLHPVCTWSVLQSSSWQSWHCHRRVPWWGIFSWLWYPTCQGRSWDHHRAQSTLSYGAGERAEEGTVPSYQSDLQLPPPHSVPLWAFWHYCHVTTTYYHLSRYFHFLLK